jgi:hypothetical protein
LLCNSDGRYGVIEVRSRFWSRRCGKLSDAVADLKLALASTEEEQPGGLPGRRQVRGDDRLRAIAFCECRKLAELGSSFPGARKRAAEEPCESCFVELKQSVHRESFTERKAGVFFYAATSGGLS